ncbi:MAG TPA: FkbM family methyltransferase [Candidatus Sulfotelmatobacter sp.]|nr:FkbM family methyltransferase [Candidatus Sulfotelmatobacter sp.]
MPRLDLTPRQRLTWCAHFFKAVAKQHHRDLLPLLGRHIGAESIVVDVGAHAGQFAKLFAGLARRGHVYAFEPGAYARSILQPMVRLRGLNNVTVIAAGLSDAVGAATLSLPIKRRGNLGFGLGHLGAGNDGRAVRAETVPLTTLDRFVVETGLKRLDFIKADIEGWEMRLLEGARQSLARFRPVLMLELVAAHLARAGDRPEDAVALLQSLGYRAYRFDDLGRALDGFIGGGDYLFLPH